jgi:hypothetical protein
MNFFSSDIAEGAAIVLEFFEFWLQRYRGMRRGGGRKGKGKGEGKEKEKEKEKEKGGKDGHKCLDERFLVGKWWFNGLLGDAAR